MVQQLNYRSAPTPSRNSTGPDVSFSEFALPLAVLVLGLLIYGGHALYRAGTRSAVLIMGFVLVVAVVQTAVGIAAAYATAAILNTSFGLLRSAFVKLAAVIAFSAAIADLIPWGGLLAFFVYLGLMLWFFGLEMYEAAVFSIIFTILRFAIVMMLVAAILGG